MRSGRNFITASIATLVIVGCFGIGATVTMSLVSHEAIMREKDATIAFACGYVAALRAATPSVNQETDYCRAIRETAIRNGYTAAQ